MPPTFTAGSASVNIVPDFQNAQRKIGQWFAGLHDVKMNVEPNLDNAAMTKVHAQVAMHRPKLRIDVDHVHLSKSVAIAIEKMTGVTEVAAKASAIIGPTLFAGAIAGLGQMAAAASVAGGALGLLPAVALAAAAPIAAVTIGMQGMTEAFKSFATGDAAKINEALANLSPAARQFVVELHDMSGTWKELRLDVQQQLFENIGSSITNLAEAQLPTLRVGLAGIAGEFGKIVSNVAELLSTQGAITDFGITLENIRAATAEWSITSVALTQAFMDIATVGSEFLPGIAGLFADGAQKAAVWVSEARRTGELTEIFSRALSMIGDLAQMVFQLGRVFVEFFRPAVESGTLLIQIITGLLEDVANFLALDTSQSSLGLFFSDIAHAVDELRPAFLAIVDVIVNSLLPGFGELIKVLAPIVDHFFVDLAALLKALAPIFPIIAQAIGALVTAAEPLIPVFSEIITSILPILAQVLSDLAPIIGEIATMVGDALLTAVKEIVPFLPPLADAFIQIMQALMPLLPALIQLALSILPPLLQLLSAIIPIVVQVVSTLTPLVIKIVQELTPALQKLAEIVTWAFETVIGPVIIWLVDNVIVPYVNFAIAAFKALGEGILWAWENMIKPTIDALAVAAVWLWQNVLQPTWELMKIGWQILADIWRVVFDSVIHPMWLILGAVITQVWGSIIQPIWELMKIGWQALAAVWQQVYDSVIHPLWDILSALIVSAWQNVILPIWTAMNTSWISLADAWKVIYDSVISPMWQIFSALVSGIWNGVILPIWNAMQATWSAVMTGIRFVYDTVIHPMWGVFQTALNGLKTAFDVIVEGIRVAWLGLRNIAAAPINFVIEYVFNRGLFAAWNWLVDTLGLPFGHASFAQITGEGITNYAYGGVVDVRKGGRVPGTFKGPREDNVVARLNPQEFVVQQPIAVRTRPFLEALNAGEAEAVQAAGGWYANGPRIGYAAGGNVDAAMAHARSMVGKPYIWGGVGPGGADCSGYMSQITNVLRGQNPYSRVGTTATFPWPGFAPGLDAAFAIGNTKSQGHMAGTLAGTAVESGSGHGPMVGGGALSATSSMFTEHGALSGSGLFAGAAAGGSGPVEPPWYVKLWGSIAGALDWLKDHIADVGKLPGMFGNAPIIQAIGAVPGKMLGWVWDAVKDAIATLFAGTSTNSAVGQVSGDTQEQVRQVFDIMRGWGQGPQWDATSWIVQKESSWNPTAQNPTSTASGLFQFIDGTWATYRPNEASSFPKAKMAPPNLQAQAGVNYIAARYGSPVDAKAFHQAHNWYDQGGWLPPGLSSIWNATGRPEPVLTASEHDSLLRWRHITQRRHAEGNRALMGDVHIHAETKRAGEIMDELFHKLRVARRGGVYSTSSVYTVG